MAVDEPILMRPAVRFGVFELDLRAGELRRNGLKVKLQEQPFQILRLLLERPGELVTHDEIIRVLWPNGTIVEYEHSVKTAVKKLRQALGDDADTPRYVETLPRRGYRFIYPIELPGARTSQLLVPNPATEKPPPHPDRAAGEAFPAGGGLPAPQKRRIWPLAAGAALVVVAAFLGYLFERPLPPPRVLGSTQITNDGRGKFATDAGPGSIHPPMVTDGSRLYFTQGSGSVSAIEQVSTAGGESSVVISNSPDSPEPLLLDISPNGSELLLFPDGASHELPLWVLPLPNGPPRRLGEAVGHDATWSPDGSKIVYVKGRDLYLAASDGNEARKLVTAPGRVDWPRWSPNGKTLRFTVGTTLWEVSADGTHLHPVLPGWSAACCGNWTPDGKYFVFESTRQGRTSIWARRETGGLLHKVDAAPMELTTSGMDTFQPVVSSDGKRIFVIGAVQRGEVLRYDSTSRQLVPYLPGLSATDLDFSRDRQWVTYVAYPSGKLWRSKTDGSERRQLTSPPMQAFSPRWSPDGKRIAFYDTALGQEASHIYIIPAEGGKPERVTHEEAAENDASWSPDGKTLVFGPGSFDQPIDIHLVDVATGHVTKLAGSEGLFSPRWSPDGKYIVALHHDGYEMALYEVSTGKWQEIGRPGAGYPSWSRDSRYIYFDTMESAFFRLRISDKKLEQVVGLENLNRVEDGWVGLGPDDSPLVVREIGTQEIYALDVEFP